MTNSLKIDFCRRVRGTSNMKAKGTIRSVTTSNKAVFHMIRYIYVSNSKKAGLKRITDEVNIIIYVE